MKPLFDRSVLCVRPVRRPGEPIFLRELKTEWIRALSREVTVNIVDQDFDMRSVMDQCRPDLVIYESLDAQHIHLPDVTSALVNPEVPRVAYLTTDPHEPLRPLFYARWHDYGISVAFQESGECAARFTPELRGVEVFSIPSFINAEVFRDYGLEKSIPISVFSAHLLPLFYPWRTAFTREVTLRFPALLYPHPGYVQRSVPFAVQGEAYARLINQSMFSVADTTCMEYVVRKHLEIPASGAVLVAPDSPALRDYGFIDMTNCVLGEGAALYDKIELVARDPALYAKICRAGHDLVHANYTWTTRLGIAQWLEAYSRRRPGERIIQRGIHAPFEVVGAETAAPKSKMFDSPMTRLLGRARDAILSGQGLEAAFRDLEPASKWAFHVGEPFFMLGMMCLLAGQIRDAGPLIGRRAVERGRIAPELALFDPVEAAWLMLIGKLLDDQSLLAAMRAQAAQASHLALRRMQWLLDGAEGPTEDLKSSTMRDTLSIHWIGQEDFSTWLNLIARIQQRYAVRLLPNQTLG